MHPEETSDYRLDICHFNELSTEELYGILKARIDVFVVEQNCAYEELDNKDQECFHLMAFQENKIVAVTRIAPPGLIYPQASIGRVVTIKSKRGQKLGYQIMKESMKFCKNELGVDTIKIAAQLYLKRFYQDLGFDQISKVYLWDGIDHIDMLAKV